jgi:hypothetical protein
MARWKLLLVEGPDDEHVVKNLCGRRLGPWLDEIVAQKGVDELLEAIRPRVLASAGEHIIGIVLDADTDLHRRWQQITGRLAASGYRDLPLQPDSAGTIIEPKLESTLPRFGIWIMPDNQRTGALEDFLRPSSTRLFEHVETSVAAIPPDEVKFSTPARPKVLLHTYLAWQAVPGNPFGTAIKRGDLRSDTPEVDAFITWLQRLYSEVSA